MIEPENFDEHIAGAKRQDTKTYFRKVQVQSIRSSRQNPSYFQVTFLLNGNIERRGLRKDYLPTGAEYLSNFFATLELGAVNTAFKFNLLGMKIDPETLSPKQLMAFRGMQINLGGTQ